MNLATLVGLVLGVILIGLASYLGAAGAGLSLMALWDTVSLLIVVGGALAATAVAFKLDEVMSIIKSLGMIFADDPYSNRDVVEDFLYILQNPNEKGELQKALEGVPESMPFRLKVVQIGCQYICDGYKKDVIRDILENMEEFRAIREGQACQCNENIGSLYTSIWYGGYINWISIYVRWDGSTTRARCRSCSKIGSINGCCSYYHIVWRTIFKTLFSCLLPIN